MVCVISLTKFSLVPFLPISFRGGGGIGFKAAEEYFSALSREAFRNTSWLDIEIKITFGPSR